METTLLNKIVSVSCPLCARWAKLLLGIPLAKRARGKPLIGNVSPCTKLKAIVVVADSFDTRIGTFPISNDALIIIA